MHQAKNFRKTIISILMILELDGFIYDEGELGELNLEHFLSLGDFSYWEAQSLGIINLADQVLYLIHTLTYGIMGRKSRESLAFLVS